MSTVFTIASGKGGVGKSVVAVNLACTLAAAGHRTALLDADLGQGACAVLLNTTPAADVAERARGAAPLRDVLHAAPGGVTLVQGAADAAAGADAHRLFGALDDVLRHLRATHDYVLIDAPAGLDATVRWALDRADLGVLVLVAEPTAVADAYRLARLLWQANPDRALGTLVNFADDEADGQSVADRFGRVTAHFTGKVPIYLGWVPFSAHVRQSVRLQVPVVHTPGPVQDAFSGCAAALLHAGQDAGLVARPA